MRIFVFATVMLLVVSIVPALAAANKSHYPCGTSNLSVSKTVGQLTVGVDVWDSACVGAVVWFQDPAIACRGPDIHAAGTHTLVLWGCQTGEIVELP